MNRKEIIDRIAERGYTKAAADVILDDIINVIMEALAEGEEVKLHGFGTFSVRETKVRTIKDMHTGENIVLEPMKMPKFTAGNKLKSVVKEGFVRA